MKLLIRVVSTIFKLKIVDLLFLVKVFNLIDVKYLDELLLAAFR